VIRCCNRCNSVDPANVKWEKGILSVDTNWSRVAIDVTHYGSKLWLTAIDCGPSRFTIWKSIRSEAGPDIVEVIESIFSESGPPQEIMLDNSTTFHSYMVKELCDRWMVFRRFRAAHRPAGNGIVERVHRTIKQMAARTQRSIIEQVFWYNARRGNLPGCRLPGITVRSVEQLQPAGDLIDHGYKVGQKVFVKKGQYARCNQEWKASVVTGVCAGPLTVEVDHVKRHIAHVRPRYDIKDSSTENIGKEVTVEKMCLRDRLMIKRPDRYGR